MKTFARRRLLSWRLAQFLIVATLQGPTYALAASAGSVSALTGQVAIQRAGHPVPVTNGTPVETGDQITTGPHSQATITLTDGTQFELAESSTITLLENQLNAAGQRVKTRLDLLGGLLHSLVHFAPGNSPNYEVHTPNAVAAARGTNYDTDYVNGVVRKEHPGCNEFTDVTVFEGVVQVTNPRNVTAGATMLNAGQKTTVPCGLLGTATSTATGPSAALTTAAIVAGAGAVAGAIAAGVVPGVTGGGSSGGQPTPTAKPSQPATGVL